MAAGSQLPTPTVVDVGARFEGLLTFRGSARIDGAVTGRVVADGTLVIGPEGQVKADVEVDELVVHGRLEGDVLARQRLELGEGGSALGTLRSPRFALAEGCRFEGRFETLESAPARPGRR